MGTTRIGDCRDSDLAIAFLSQPCHRLESSPHFLEKGIVMDLNLIVLAGTIAAEPELRTFDSGSTLLRGLVTVRSSEPRRRLDVIPFSLWNPDEDVTKHTIHVGTPVWIRGAIQRRFWSDDDGRRSRLEVVAHEVSLRSPDQSSGTTPDKGVKLEAV